MLAKSLLLTAATAFTAVSALPNPFRASGLDKRAPDADDQPLFLLEIHPANRTDLCLALTAPEAVVNSSVQITSCNATTPNNETFFYKTWTLQESDEAEDDPNFGFMVRLNGTRLCLDNRYNVDPTENVAIKLNRCDDDSPTQQFLYSTDGQFNVPRTFQCLGISDDVYNYPQLQGCQVAGDWTLEAFPQLTRSN